MIGYDNRGIFFTAQDRFGRIGVATSYLVWLWSVEVEPVLTRCIVYISS